MVCTPLWERELVVFAGTLVMGVTLRSIIIAALLTICAGLMYRISGLTGQISTDDIKVRYPTFEAQNFTAKLYNQEGAITHSIFAQEVAFYQNKDLVLTRGLSGFFYDHKQQEATQGWQITADSGEIIFNQVANLKGNIKVKPNYATAAIKEITTPEVYFNMQTNEISSRAKITIKGAQFVNEGSNYSVDLTKKTFVIKDKPHAVYYP